AHGGPRTLRPALASHAARRGARRAGAARRPGGGAARAALRPRARDRARMTGSGGGVVIDEMTLEDVAEVQEGERAAVTAPWRANAFRHELTQNRNARYIVARERGRIVGYAGLWNAVGEAHITTFAVHPEARRRGIGQRMLLRIFELTDVIAKDLGTGVA